ncbi:Cyclic di-GMP phosphodiesterase response regulator RpfG [Sporomusa ovata DSM 2662]|uniref:Response regulator/sensory box/HDIG domain protein n=1 Tax=Sporomusa ovata TaxID=2378 RepID=A0A0U1KSC4_9FIRM|nr:HD-GYP domain-containing protein [Sporomusa ovata]EQB26235.1 cyclic di-GMP phosphodiesterase response regulator RpfG [Sporomusa ovata DSM 2662]CQR70311.1 Response regulator/sensory box/HDIG domain protein [Sporomusa ovata]
MNLIFTKDLVPGMCTGRDVIAGDGFIKLLTQGAVLNQSQIDSLRNWGVPAINIDDPTEKMQEKVIAVHMTKTEFAKGYTETIDKIVHAFRHIKKFREVPIAEMQELVDQKIILLAETIGVLEHLHDIRCYSENTFNHSLHVAIITGILGKWCNYRGTELKKLILTGLLHDIGKLVVPLSILNKPGRLSAEEFAAIKKHPQDGYQVLKDARIPENIKLGIWQHHERLDGSGYPLGLIGDEICAEAKIISIADVYDAITSDRVYRRKMTPFEALDILADDLFEKLEPVFCLTFMDNMRDYLIGSSVILSNGQKADIIAFYARDRGFTKPVVCTQNGKLLDLQQEELCITGVG